MVKIAEILGLLRRNYALADTAVAVVILAVLICGIACSLSSSFAIRPDPNTVSLSYTVTTGGETIRYYETNASLDKMYIHNNPSARNVTYDELISFILSDPTDRIPYNNSSFVCIDYAVAVHDNAERQNITAGVVTCDFNESRHALDVFNTTDRGLVYIDCTGAGPGQPAHDYDKIASIDGVYRVEPIVDIAPDYYINDKNDTVTNVHVYW